MRRWLFFVPMYRPSKCNSGLCAPFHKVMCHERNKKTSKNYMNTRITIEGAPDVYMENCSEIGRGLLIGFVGKKLY